MPSPLSPSAAGHDSSAASSSRSRRDSKKKALLIGINGLSSPAVGYDALHGPHQDVADMRNLLIGTYGYLDEDIQVLVDDGISEHLQPDRRNILNCIDALANGAQAGDKLFFHYCGHTVQVPSRSNTEEDGLDECIVPLDGEDCMIHDNELRARLVDKLPGGTSLVAVFDSCHSASLLDLEHLRCNRVFVPWVSKEKRRSTGIGARMAQQLAISPVAPTARTMQQSPTRICLCSPLLSPRMGPCSPLSPRRSPRSPLSFRAAPWNIPVTDREGGASGAGTLRRTLSVPHSPSSRKSRTPAPLKLWDTNKENLGVNALATGSPPSPKPISPPPQSALPTPWTACESPEESYCKGWCRAGGSSPFKSEDADVPDVISLASCKDSELSWESPQGAGMTQALIQVLEIDPHPSLRDLVTEISHTLHVLAMERHLRAQTWNRYRKARGIKSAGTGSFDTETFQHPQIASHKPLDLDSKWDI
ncbi:peptidase C14, caspase domain-containing protein [Mycena vitilis]|nr:peptidase C14, caspase domain-containing protein [Mycena vitilis]